VLRRAGDAHVVREIIVAWASAKAREDFYADLERRSAALPAVELSPIGNRIDQAGALRSPTSTG